MSKGMIELRRRLADRYGEGYGRIMLVQMCQQRGLDATKDEPTDEMRRAVR